jgi:hypothetical protein
MSMLQSCRLDDQYRVVRIPQPLCASREVKPKLAPTSPGIVNTVLLSVRLILENMVLPAQSSSH